VVDRLLDLNTKQNRVTVLKTTVVSEAATANLSVLGSGRKVSDSSETELIAKLRADLASERELITNLRSELSSGTDLIAKLKKDLTSKDSQLESLRNRIEELRMLNENISTTVTNPSPPSKTALDELNILREELANMISQVNSSESRRKEGEERMESLEAENSASVSALLNVASIIRERRETSENLDAVTRKEVGLSEAIQKGFEILTSSMLDRLESMQMELNMLIAQKDSLECDLSSAVLEKDMVNRDIQVLSTEHDAIKGAYHALESELFSAQQSFQQERKKLSAAAEHQDGSISESLKQELQLAKDRINELTTQLTSQVRKSMDLEKLLPRMQEMQDQMLVSENDRLTAVSNLKELQSENENYKKMIDSLKAKIKDLSSSSGKDSKDFMDTFEEVMREEMSAMKSAFELKLRAAKEDNENTSKRYQREISLLKSSLSPSPSISLLGSR